MVLGDGMRVPIRPPVTYCIDVRTLDLRTGEDFDQSVDRKKLKPYYWGVRTSDKVSG